MKWKEGVKMSQEGKETQYKAGRNLKKPIFIGLVILLVIGGIFGLNIAFEGSFSEIKIDGVVYDDCFRHGDSNLCCTYDYYDDGSLKERRCRSGEI